VVVESRVFAASRGALTIGILVTVSAIAFEGMAVTTVLPTAADELGGVEAYGWAFSAFMLASLLGAIGAVQAAERRGLAVPSLAGFAAFAIGLLVAGLAPTWVVVLLGRALQGLGGGSLGAIAYLAIARGYPERQRPRMLALLSSAWVLPALVGPALAGQVAEYSSWRLVLLGIVPLAAVGAWLLVRSLPPAQERPMSQPTPAGRFLLAVRLAGGGVLVLWAAGLSELGQALIVGGAGLVLAVPALRSLLPAGTASGGSGLPAAVAVRGLIAFGFFGCDALIPLGLASLRGVPPSRVGLALTAGALAWVAGSWLQDRAEARSGGELDSRRVRVMLGLGSIVLGIGGVASVILWSALPVELGVVAWAVAGLGMGLAYPGSTLVAMSTAGSGQDGLAAASLQVAETIGFAAGAGVGGALIALAVHLERGLDVGLGWAFVVTLAAALLAFAPAARLVPGERVDGSESHRVSLRRAT
jgi:MFS family permease